MEIFLKTEDEILLVKRASQLVSKTLAEIAKIIRPGISTLQLDTLAETFIRDHGGIPILKDFPNPFGKPFPATICTSRNAVVAHGIPKKNEIIQNGDIISVDCALLLDGYCGDSCYTFQVGDVHPRMQYLVENTKEALNRAINSAVVGGHLQDIGNAIQKFSERKGLGIVRELTGHGLGKELHEGPQITNYGNKGEGPLLKSSLTLAIEPMLTLGNAKIGLLPDKWGVITLDGQPSAHFEHTIAIRKGQTEVLSSFDEIEKIERENHKIWQNNLR